MYKRVIHQNGISAQIPQMDDFREEEGGKQFNMYSGAEIKELEEQVRELKIQISHKDKQIAKLT